MDPDRLSKDINLAYLGNQPVSMTGLLKWVKNNPVPKSKLADTELTRIWIKVDFKISGINIHPFKNLINELSRDETIRISVGKGSSPVRFSPRFPGSKSGPNYPEGPVHQGATGPKGQYIRNQTGSKAQYIMIKLARKTS